MKSRKDATSLTQIATVTAKPRISDKEQWSGYTHPWQSLFTESHVITHDNFAFRKGLIISGLMHNSPAEAMLACLNP